MKKRLTLLLSAMAFSCSTTALATPTQVKVSINSGQALRSGTAQTAGTWCSQWLSNTQLNGTAAVTISGQDTKNNLSCPAVDGITLAEGSAAKSYTYTISAPSGYVFTTMQADLIAGDASNTPTISINEQQAITTSTVQKKVNISDINKRQFTIAMSSSSNNASATFTNFELTLMTREEAGITEVIPYTLSTDEEQHWYYIINEGDNNYSKGRVLIASGNDQYMSFGQKELMADRLWSFWAGNGGKLAIKNYNNIYVGTAPAGTGGSTAVKGTSSVNAIYNITSFNDYYTIDDGNGAPLHAQNDGSKIVRWQADGSNASLWSFQEVNVDNPEVKLSSTTVQQGKVTTGIGNQDVAILRSTLNVSGLTGTLPLTEVKGKITATNLKDVTAVRAYMATNTQELFIDRSKSMPWREENGRLLGQGTIQTDGTYTIEFSDTELTAGTHYLWITLDISDQAKEGNTVDATISEYTIGGKSHIEVNGNPQHAATIFLSESAVLMPMDKGSLYYRIPAITATADGKRLVTLTDDRVGHNGDLPAHVWLVAQYSDDGGKTWSDPKRIAGTATTGGNYGHGDAQIITNRFTGEIIGIMTSSPTSNAGFFGSTVENPQAWKVIKSKDGGETWSVPVDHTQSLYAKNSPHTNIKGGFSGSGAGLQKRDGTLISPFVGRDIDNQKLYFNIISKDGGDTWQIFGTSGTTDADEPKILERNNGDLAISVRASGYNYYNVTSDDGQTWKKAPQTRFNSGISGNACDGEYMVWTSTLDGNPWNITLQTMPNSGSREKVSIALSTDEGETFGTPKIICPRGSAYSAATIMADGTLGVYYEENGVFGGYTMRFVRFSLDWASNGKYKFTENQPFYPIKTNVTTEVPSDGWQTLTVPFDFELPSELQAYTADGELHTLGSAPETYRALTCTPVADTKLKAHTPYLIHGTPGTYTFRQPLNEWQPTAMPENCEMKNGVLHGWYVNKNVMQNDKETIYNNLFRPASLGKWVFRRVTTGKAAGIKAFHCNLELPQTDELYLYPTTREVCDGIQQPKIEMHSNTDTYNLQGQHHRKGKREIVIRNGQKVIVQ